MFWQIFCIASLAHLLHNTWLWVLASLPQLLPNLLLLKQVRVYKLYCNKHCLRRTLWDTGTYSKVAGMHPVFPGCELYKPRVIHRISWEVNGWMLDTAPGRDSSHTPHLKPITQVSTEHLLRMQRWRSNLFFHAKFNCSIKFATDMNWASRSNKNIQFEDQLTTSTQLSNPTIQLITQ
jgi:hypothetical protein